MLYTSDGKPAHMNIEDEVRLLQKETTLTTETGIKTIKTEKTLMNQTVRRSKRLPFAKQTESLGDVPCYVDNDKNNK